MITLFGLALAVGLAAGCSSSSPPPAIPEAAGAGAAGGAPIGDISGYKLGPGDALRVTVFRHEDLSGEFSLDGEGYFALPLVGEILAGGRTARQVESEVEVALKSGGYLVDPQVSIEVLNYRPFYIIGEVNQPGSFEYVSGMTVINAVALAGGYTYRADQDDIIISRGGSNGPRIEALADTEVLPGDIIEVTERFF
ncbi:MAG: polysaccharide biosynthesis/export family protein [Geminicoccaceae bacterium]